MFENNNMIVFQDHSHIGFDITILFFRLQIFSLFFSIPIIRLQGLLVFSSLSVIFHYIMTTVFIGGGKSRLMIITSNPLNNFLIVNFPFIVTYILNWSFILMILGSCLVTSIFGETTHIDGLRLVFRSQWPGLLGHPLPPTPHDENIWRCHRCFGFQSVGAMFFHHNL